MVAKNKAGQARCVQGNYADIPVPTTGPLTNAMGRAQNLVEMTADLSARIDSVVNQLTGESTGAPAGGPVRPEVAGTLGTLHAQFDRIEYSLDILRSALIRLEQL
jgi:hypothetical protein